MSEEEISVPNQEQEELANDLSKGPSTDPVDADTDSAQISQLRQQVSDLEERLAKESEHATDYMNRYQRIQADFANFKRRAQHEQEQRDTVVAAQVISLFLPALDSFERAFATLPPSLRGYSWIDGISLVLMEMQRALQVYGVVPIEVQSGHAFDPSRHESVGEVETSGYPAGHVAVVVQTGYEVQGRTLRPTLVQLARPATATTAESSAEPGEVESGSSVEGEEAR